MKDYYMSLYECGYEESPYFDPEWEMLTTKHEEHENEPEYTENEIKIMEAEDNQ